MIYRAYYAFINNLRINSKGEDVSAILGFVNIFSDIIKKEMPSHCAVVFDPATSTFRHDMYPEYKAQRPKTPEGILFGVPFIKRIINAMGIKTVWVDGFEADDAIGTLAKKAEKEGFEVFMVTSDKDYNQLLSQNIYLYKPKKGSEVEIYNQEGFKEIFELDDPLQFIDILSLWGDASDNVKGVTGIGEKTAFKLIKEFGSIDNIYANIDKLKGKQKENFINDKQTVALAKKLVTIVTDCPINFNEEEYKVKEQDNNLLIEIYNSLELKNLAQKLQKPQVIEPNLFNQSFSQEPNLFSQTISLKTIKDTPHNYQTINTLEELQRLVNNILEQKEFCFDTETTGLDIINSHLVGMSFCFKEFEAYYLPFYQDEDDSKKIEILRPILESKELLKIGQNLKFDISILKNYKIEVANPIFDTMLAHYLLFSEQRHNMDILAEQYLNYKTIHIEELIGSNKSTQKNMKDVDIQKITDYAAEDADVTLRLKNVLYPKLEGKNLLEVANKYEMPLVRVLSAMEYQGVCIDSNYLKEYSLELNQKAILLEKEIFEIAKHEFNLASPKKLGEVLFDELEIKPAPKKTKTGQYATSEDELIKLEKENPIIAKILEYRGLKKLTSTYTDALVEIVNPTTNRIHTSFNQAITATGRLSSTNPNIQNIPIRTKEGQAIRKAFVASPNNKIFAADYSQIELRVMADVSDDKNLIEAFQNDLDIHASTAALINGIDIKDVTKEMRRNAKSANFGIIYGISAFGLSNDTGLSRTEAKNFIDKYFENYPKLKEFMDNQIKFAVENSMVKTLGGHIRQLSDIHSRNAIVRSSAERNAINTPIQGTAAEIIKLAMINIFERFQELKLKSKLIIQVHDELVFDVDPKEKEIVKQEVTSIMENAFKLKVPLKVSGEFGENWLEAH